MIKRIGLGLCLLVCAEMEVKKRVFSLHDSLFNGHVSRKGLCHQARYIHFMINLFTPLFLQVIPYFLNHFCHGHNPAGDSVQISRQLQQQQQVRLDSTSTWFVVSIASTGRFAGLATLFQLGVGCLE